MTMKLPKRTHNNLKEKKKRDERTRFDQIKNLKHLTKAAHDNDGNLWHCVLTSEFSSKSVS